MIDAHAVTADRRWDRWIAGVAVLLFVLGAATLLGAAQDKDARAALDIELAWQKNWKNYARRCVKIRDTYYVLATYENQFPSSRGMTTVALRQKTAREYTERSGSMKVKRNLVKPNVEIDLGVKTLPQVAYGHYGEIHSAQVVEVLGPDEMMIANIWIVEPESVKADRDKERERFTLMKLDRGDMTIIMDWMFEYRDDALRLQSSRDFRSPIKLRGYSTAGLSKGERWTGKDGPLSIAIAGFEEGQSRSKTRKAPDVLVAIPAGSFARGISDEKEFLALLAARGHTKESFVALMKQEQSINPTDSRLADAMIYMKIDGKTEKEEEEPVKPKEPRKPSF